jgi:hypothetical protein
MKIEAGVRHFENNNEEYAKIKKTEEKVHSILSDRRMVLKLPLLSLTESMRKDPDKFSHLIYNNNTSLTPRTQATDYDTASYVQQQQYPSQAYTDMLLEEAEKTRHGVDFCMGSPEPIPLSKCSLTNFDYPVLFYRQEKLFATPNS